MSNKEKRRPINSIQIVSGQSNTIDVHHCSIYSLHHDGTVEYSRTCSTIGLKYMSVAESVIYRDDKVICTIWATLGDQATRLCIYHNSTTKQPNSFGGLISKLQATIALRDF